MIFSGHCSIIIPLNVALKTGGHLFLGWGHRPDEIGHGYRVIKNFYLSPLEKPLRKEQSLQLREMRHKTELLEIFRRKYDSDILQLFRPVLTSFGSDIPVTQVCWVRLNCATFGRNKKLS